MYRAKNGCHALLLINLGHIRQFLYKTVQQSYWILVSPTTLFGLSDTSMLDGADTVVPGGCTRGGGL